MGLIEGAAQGLAGPTTKLSHAIIWLRNVAVGSKAVKLDLRFNWLAKIVPSWGRVSRQISKINRVTGVMTRKAASAVIRTDQFDNADSAVGVAIFPKAYHDQDPIRSISDLCGSRQAQPFWKSYRCWGKLQRGSRCQSSTGLLNRTASRFILRKQVLGLLFFCAMDFLNPASPFSAQAVKISPVSIRDCGRDLVKRFRRPGRPRNNLSHWTKPFSPPAKTGWNQSLITTLEDQRTGPEKKKRR